MGSVKEKITFDRDVGNVGEGEFQSCERWLLPNAIQRGVAELVKEVR